MPIVTQPHSIEKVLEKYPNMRKVVRPVCDLSGFTKSKETSQLPVATAPLYCDLFNGILRHYWTYSEAMCYLKRTLHKHCSTLKPIRYINDFSNHLRGIYINHNNVF